MSNPDAPTVTSAEMQKKPLLDRWHIAREIIKHEDGLYDQRLRSLLTLHGFLFASVAVIVSVATNKDHQAYSLFLFIFVLVPCWVGYRTACRVHDPLQAARQQVAVAALWWTWTATGNDVGPLLYQSHFPPIIGGKEYYNRYDQDLIEASQQEHRKTSNTFQSLERFLKFVWLMMFFVMFIVGVIYFTFIHLESYDECIQSPTATATATANNTPSNGWSQHVRCLVMPLSRMPSENSKTPGGTGQTACVSTQP